MLARTIPGEPMRASGLVCVFWFALVPASFAQEIDTAILAPSSRPFTILDQIERPKEKQAFLALFKQRDARRRLDAARFFLQSYPDSWILAEVYDIAAKASIDVGNFADALAYSRSSLRIFPENPLLLVPVANLQVQQGLLRQGERSARDALDYLQRFARPSSVRESDWPNLKRKLEASALYALGRAEMTAAPALAAPDRAAELRDAAAVLARAADLNPDDAEIQYLLGLAHLSVNDRPSAARAFAAAARVPGPLQARAAGQLRELHWNPADQRHSAPAPPPRTNLSAPGRYAGSDVCRACHMSEYAGWQQTGMARMFRPYRRENVFGDFSGGSSFDKAAGEWPARAFEENGRYYFAVRGAGNVWERYPIDFTIGSKWQQAYATRLANGEIHVFPLQYSRVRESWVNYWKTIDPPRSRRADLRLFHNLSSSTNYQANCAPCHTSQLRTRKPNSTELSEIVFTEGGVNCEMCHGPSAGHVESIRRAKRGPGAANQAPVSFARLDHREYVTICGQCHMQSAILEHGPDGEWNYSTTDGVFHARYSNRSLTDFSRRAFYKDGRFRETTFIGEAFLRSACYRRGQAQCGNCHNPHPADAVRNPTSLRYPDRPDQMCLQCHTGYVRRVEAHTHHAQASEASRCISCHMPRIMNSVLFFARTHQIDDVPTADTTLRFGQEESPNACLLCHRDKNGQWVAAALKNW